MEKVLLTGKTFYLIYQCIRKDSQVAWLGYLKKEKKSQLSCGLGLKTKDLKFKITLHQEYQNIYQWLFNFECLVQNLTPNPGLVLDLRPLEKKANYWLCLCPLDLDLDPLSTDRLKLLDSLKVNHSAVKKISSEVIMSLFVTNPYSTLVSLDNLN